MLFMCGNSPKTQKKTLYMKIKNEKTKKYPENFVCCKFQYGFLGW